MILEHGTDAQRAAWLERFAAGEIKACLALSEDDAGSDINGISTTATRNGDGYVLNGTKRWVSNGSIADVAVVLAKLEDGSAGLFLSSIPSG